LNTTTLVQTPSTPDSRGTAPQNQITFNPYPSSSTTWQSWDKQITPAPEPATYGAMMMSAALGLLGYRRWRKQANVKRS
jgi:hypothetical protein